MKTGHYTLCPAFLSGKCIAVVPPAYVDQPVIPLEESLPCVESVDFRSCPHWTDLPLLEQLRCGEVVVLNTEEEEK